VADCLAIDCAHLPAAAPAPLRSYAGLELMAHDYDSLLRALLDRLGQLAPDWQDRNEADLGMVLLELFAFAGDQLAHLQDRVALEGYLRTASQRESLRRLLRLVDAGLDPGNAARTWLQFEVSGSAALYLPPGFAVHSRDGVVFESDEAAMLQPALGRIALAADAPSSADGRELRLAADLGGLLAPGAMLLLQQGRQRALVQLQSLVAGAVSVLTLTQPLAGRYAMAQASVHGNLVPASHGASQRGLFSGNGAAGQRLVLELAPLVWQDSSADGIDGGGVAEPALVVTVDGEPWVRVEDFIDSQPADRHFRIVTDNEGEVTLQFGDGDQGAAPPAGAAVLVAWRVGGGRAGEVGADALTEFDRGIGFALPDQRIVAVRNPLASRGGRDPQSLDAARLLGPATLRRQARAVTAADYEAVLAQGVRLAGRHWAPLQSRARFVFTGAWQTVVVSVELPGRQRLAGQPGLRAAFELLLDRHRMAGLDLRVEDARWCPLHLSLRLEVDDSHFARDVRNAVQAVLLGPSAAGAAPAFFAPGRMRFGQAVHLSDLYAVVSAVEGVRSVAVLRFKRLGDRYPDREAAGFIEVGALELARCDNGAPEFGVLALSTRGGKEG
jgi:hypothetical protein